MFLVYQIGDVVLYDALLGANGDPVEAAFSRSWSNPSTAFQQGGGRQYHGPLLRSLPEEVEFEVSGRLFQTPYINASRMKSRILSFAGRRNTPVIIVKYEESYTSNCLPKLTWLIGYGTITDLPTEHNYYGAESGGSFVSTPLELNVKISEPFQQLSQWFWEYRSMQERLSNPYSEDAAQEGLNGFRHPQDFTEIQPNHYFVRWQSSDTMYTPEFWGLNYLYQMDGGQSSDFVNGPLNLFVYSDEDLWSVAPRSMYAFTNLSPFGTITITTKLKSGLFYGDEVESTTTLDLAQLDTDLAAAGFGGLAIDDILFTGAVNPRPGFIQRYGNTLAAVRPKWIYDQSYPGEISKGATWITFQPYLTDMQVAYNIDFRAV